MKKYQWIKQFINFNLKLTSMQNNANIDIMCAQETHAINKSNFEKWAKLCINNYIVLVI